VSTSLPKPARSLLVFADDWGRHPSSCQHIVGRLLPKYRVAWVNTIGMRRPGLNLVTLRRGLQKFGSWLGAKKGYDTPSGQPENLTVVDPRMWPWFSKAHDRAINRRLLLRSLMPQVADLPRPVVAITTLPIVADLVGALPVDRWVYYCVDDFGTWPGLDHRPLVEMEQRLVAAADRIVAAGENLQQRLELLGRPAPVLTHGVDLQHWQVNGDARRLPALEGFQRPLIVFWGIIDQRMDVAMVNRLAEQLERGTIALVGPLEDPDPALWESPRVAHVPPLPYADLPQLAAAADVLVMPYRDLPVTQAMQPLKLKEYLATGRPAVVSRLPSVEPWTDCLDVVSSPEEFASRVQWRIQTGRTEQQRVASRRLAEEDWEAKAVEFARLALA